MKKIILLPFLFATLLCNAQNPNIKRTWHWYFGNHAGIDFSSGIAVADTSGALVTSEGCASISDTSGNLLFYSDGRTVWNKLNQVMPNGIGLMGGANGSSSQQALIIPKPLSPNLYYIFTTDEAENYGANGMRYTVIDMNLDGGLGDVDINQKNILLFAPCTEKLAAVNHCNDTSVWVLGHETNNNHFRAYLVRANGIDTNSVISIMGYPQFDNVFNSISGSVKFSPNGKKICIASDSSLRRIELFNFDNFSGIISGLITLSKIDTISHAISFSPDNSKLYIGRYADGLYQYDITSNDSATIIGTRTLIHSFVGGFPGFRYMENGSDGKIYILHSPQGDSIISKIDAPNNSGISCNLSLFSVSLIKPSTRSGLPIFNESYFNQSTSNGCLTGISDLENNVIKIFPNSARDWIILEGRGIRSVEITNALGSTIGSYPTTTSALRNMLNISSLSCGIYFLKINMIDERFSLQKIIVQH